VVDSEVAAAVVMAAGSLAVSIGAFELRLLAFPAITPGSALVLLVVGALLIVVARDE
jgi:hypothetical protein